MSQSRLVPLVILGVTTITAAGFAIYHYQRAEELAAALAAAEQSPPDLPSPDALSEEAGEEIATEKELAALARMVPPPEEETGDDAPERTRPGRGEMARRFEELMSDPEFAKAMQLQQRSRLDQRYADLFAQLNLPAATLAQLQDLLIEKQNVARDVMMAAREQGFGREDRDQLRELIAATQSEIDAEIISTIGEQNYATLEAYEQTDSQRATVEQLSSRLSYSGTPLNDVQSQALTTILAETTATADTGGFGRGRNEAIITDETIARAQAVLSTDQLEALTTLQEEQQAAQLISQTMRDQRPPPGG